jgi:hypothetical protein
VPYKTPWNKVSSQIYIALSGEICDVDVWIDVPVFNIQMPSFINKETCAAVNIYKIPLKLPGFACKCEPSLKS